MIRWGGGGLVPGDEGLIGPSDHGVDWKSTRPHEHPRGTVVTTSTNPRLGKSHAR